VIEPDRDRFLDAARRLAAKDRNGLADPEDVATELGIGLFESANSRPSAGTSCCCRGGFAEQVARKREGPTLVWHHLEIRLDENLDSLFAGGRRRAASSRIDAANDRSVSAT
jgi:hypothetical protein